MSALLHDPLLLLALGAGLGALLLLLAFGEDGNGKMARRAARLNQRMHEVAINTELKLRRDSGDRLALDRLAKRFIPQPELLRRRLQRTGKSIGLGAYALSCVITALVGGASLLLSGLSLILAIPGGLIIGLWLPHLAVGFLAGRRGMRFTLLFPEAIGLMVRSVKSGLPITESFQIVGREVPDPVGAEFRHLADQIRLGQPVDQALWETARRVDTPEMKFLVVTLSVQRETGGNLAETLENLDSILRRRRQMRLKIKAMSSEARASAMIIGSLPFLMMALLAFVDYGYIAILFTRPLGHTLLAGAACSMSLGIGTIARMVRFEI